VTNPDLEALLAEIDEILAWIGECQQELQIAEDRLARLQSRRDELEAA